jgi:hypothetical protein
MKIIETERPSDHWGFLEIKERVVLDLGHGIWEQNVDTTPVYFLNEGASMVIGIDPNEPSYNWYRDNLKTDRFFQHNDFIDSTEKFKFYINAYKPQVLKIDIEGGEIFMNNLTAEDMESVREIGVEYHSLACRVTIETMATHWGFNIEEQYQLMNIPIGGMGVYHLKKPKQVTMKLRNNENN